MELEERATKEVLDKADIVAATCIAAGDPRLAGRNFRLCAVDEATQVREVSQGLDLQGLISREMKQ